jgi:hypothetical protein
MGQGGNPLHAARASLDDLLKRHRLLALERAPIGERLAVLRQIAQRDARNPVWDQDMVAFEKVRLRQIEFEVDQLKRRVEAPPLDQLDGLVKEMQGAPWKTPLSPELLATVLEMHKAVRNRYLQERVDQLAQDLAAAQRNKDEQRARQLEAEWKQLTGQDGAAPSASSSKRASDAMQWLNKLDQQNAKKKQHQQAVEVLRKALADPETPATDLEDLYEAADEDKPGVPAELETVYRRRVRDLVAARKLRETLIWASICLFGICALVGFIIFIKTR